MKKLLSFLAAGALALGLIGCSGDLHDTVDPSTIPLSIALQSAPRLGAGGVPGAMNGWDNTTTWTSVNNDTCTYTYDFVATAETIEWKAITTAGNWNSGAWGGGDNEALSVPLDTKTALVYDGATGGKKNASTSGLKVNKVYTITLNYENGGYSATVTSSEKEKPVPFYLVGFFVSGDFNSDATDLTTVLSNPTADTQTGYVTYEYKFVATATEQQFSIKNPTDKYTGADFGFGTDEDYVATTLNASAKNKITGLTAGKKYILHVQTKPDGTVSYKVTLATAKIVGAKIENLDTTKFPDGTKIIFNGGWNNWGGSWDSKSSYLGEAKSGTCKADWDAVIVKEAKDYETLAVGLKSDGNPDWNNMRIAKIFNVDAGNATLTITDAQLDDGEYIIYIDMAGIDVGDAITWEVKAKE